MSMQTTFRQRAQNLSKLVELDGGSWKGRPILCFRIEFPFLIALGLGKARCGEPLGG